MNLRRLFLFSLVAIVLGVWLTLALGFPTDPGYLLIAYGNNTFETSLFAMLVAAGLFFVVLRLLLGLLHGINPFRLYRAGKELVHSVRSKKGSRSVEGLLFLVRGNFRAAYNNLVASADDEDGSVVNYLAAAVAACELGENEVWQQCLERAEWEFPAHRTTVQTLKAQLLYRSGQLEQCLAVVEMLRRNALNDGPLLMLLKQVYMDLQEWRKLQEVLPALEKKNLLNEDESAVIRKQILYTDLSEAAHQIGGDGDRKSLLKAMQKTWKKADAAVRTDAELVQRYADLLYDIEAREEAAEVLEKSLAVRWSAPLVLSYSEKDYGVNNKQLMVAEHWLKARPADPDLLLTLARLSMRNELWDKAKDYYQARIRVSPSKQAYAELSRLLRHLGEGNASRLYLENYEDLISADQPELPLPTEVQKLPH